MHVEGLTACQFVFIYFVLNIRLRSYDYNMHVEGLLPAYLCSFTLF